MTSTDPPTFMIVPGAWHKRFHVRPTLDALEKRGYTARCIDLATVQTDKPRPTWDQEVANISSNVIDELKSGHDVCLVLHSYAGLPGGEAVNRIVQAGGLSAATDRKGVLRRVIFFSAHHTPTGFVMDVKNFIGPAHPSFTIDEETNMSHHRTPYEDFFNDIPTREEAQPYIDEIKPMHYIPGGGGIMTDDWMRAPRSIVGTTKDKAIVPALQEQMWNDFKDEIVWIDTGHTPFMAVPERIADVFESELSKSSSAA